MVPGGRSLLEGSIFLLNLTCEASVCDVKHETGLGPVLVVSVALICLIPLFFISVELSLSSILILWLVGSSCGN